MDSIAEGMTLDETRVRISPLVPSVILDYYMRNWRKEESNEDSGFDKVELVRKHNDYTIGVLLGIEIEANVVVTNAYGVKYDRSVSSFNKDYSNFMMKYLTKGTKETVVGMFHVSKPGQDINDYGVMKAYATIRDEQNAKSKWILLTLDGSLEQPTLNMKTYFPLDFDFGSTAENLWVFVETPHEVITEDMAATGLDTVLFGQENYDTLSIYWREASNAESITLDKIEDLKRTQRLFSSGEKLKMNITSISALLENAREYVNGVEAGKIESDAKIDRALNSALSKIAHVTPESIENLLKDHYQDLLYISKLNNLIKDQLLISQKLTSQIK